MLEGCLWYNLVILQRDLRCQQGKAVAVRGQREAAVRALVVEALVRVRVLVEEVQVLGVAARADGVEVGRGVGAARASTFPTPVWRTPSGPTTRRSTTGGH